MPINDKNKTSPSRSPPKQASRLNQNALSTTQRSPIASTAARQNARPGPGSVTAEASGMGNGTSSSSTVVIDNDEYDSKGIKELVGDLTLQVKTKDHKIRHLEEELQHMKEQMVQRNTHCKMLETEIDKLRSVLDLKVQNNAKAEFISTINKTSHMAGQEESRLKKQGVSGESGGTFTVELRHIPKDEDSKDLIRKAIMKNDFLKNISQGQLNEIVECMFLETVASGCYIIREGESGTRLYVAAEGQLQVLKEGKVLGTMTTGQAFGELALLYNCNRTASVIALNSAKLWVLDRRVFQTIMVRSGQQRQEENLRFLKSIPLLRSVPFAKMAKIADALEEDYYSPNHVIVREGERGDVFFIIKTGKVRVTQLVQGFAQPQEVRILTRGDYFGEKALLSEDCRTANCIAMDPHVEVLTLDRESFIQLIGQLNELKEKDYGDEKRGAQRLLKPHRPTDVSPHPVADSLYANTRLTDFDKVATLGVGGFGRVELVVYSKDKSKSLALKCLSKKHIVKTRQQEHVCSERRIMLEVNSPFICTLHRTFRDAKYVYMLLDACLGGELWTILRDAGNFDDITTRFSVGCALEAIQYLHERAIIYRDLKPENLLLGTDGYIKLCDFGFAKKIGHGRKTWTFCGTPEYVAPEIILNKGHDFSADYWSLGILMYELLTGTPPFTGSDPMKIYNIILRGVDAIDFPKKISRNAIAIIKKLCRDNASERLGYGKGGIADIKKNKYFQGFDWDGLSARTLTPPIVRPVKNVLDSSNFDKFPPESDAPPDENSGWDIDF